MKYFCSLMHLLVFSALLSAQSAPTTSPPLRVGIAGLVHTHVHWILGREERGDIQIVGIAEPNRELAERYSSQHGFSMDIVYDSVEEMLEATRPEAVTAFNTIYGHLEVAEQCAPRGIHVMVEKPLPSTWIMPGEWRTWRRNMASCCLPITRRPGTAATMPLKPW